ncbi:hypothetical protein BASA81_001013 [Batrachochytrium salamandrivorans]|nr:hypothetical protein BASA81_001013 [Batrachochytrium salamandrivorans]
MSDVKLTEFDRFSPVCARYGTTPQASRIVICKGRKVGFVLDFGSVTSPACFLEERPTKSTKDSEVLDMILIPNGWKIALEVKRTIYVGETLIRGGQASPLYRFSRIDAETGEAVDVSEYKELPTPAFSEVAQRHLNPQSIAEAERPNGKLYMGVQYTEAQLQLKKQSKTMVVAPEAQEAFTHWINLQPTSCSTTSTAAVGGSNGIAPKRKLGASLEHIGSIVQHTIDNKEEIKSEIDLVSSRPSKLQKEGSLRGAMKLLRENSLEFTPDDLEFDSLGVKSAGKMTAEALFYAFKNPDVNYLNVSQIKRAMETLLQMAVPKRLVEETFAACDTEKTGQVTLQNFVQVIRRRDEELWQQFCRIDYDGNGEITLDELKLAKQNGVFMAQERELNTLLDAMDRVSSQEGDHAFVDQKIQWHEFRAMMVLLPPASTIQVIVDVVKNELEERDMIKDAFAPMQSLPTLSTTSTTTATGFDISPLHLFYAQKQQQQQYSFPYPPPQQQQQYAFPSTSFSQYPSYHQQQQQTNLPPPRPVMPAPLNNGGSSGGLLREFEYFLTDLELPPVPSFPQPLKKPAAFERSSSFQQYPLLHSRTASPVSTAVATSTTPGGSATGPDMYREVFGRDEEFESIFEGYADNSALDDHQHYYQSNSQFH